MTIFSEQAAVVADIRAERLILAGETYFPGITLSDGYIYGKLLAAEAEASRQLRVYLEPTIIVPDDAPQSELDALEAGEDKYATEPAYDYDPDFFRGEKWGYIVTRSKPIISVDSISFSYPSPVHQIFTIPSEWIRMDRKYGHIRLVPASQTFAAPLSAFIMQALGGGRTVPFMIHVRYTAGLTDAAGEWPDLVDVIKKMAVLRIIADKFQPQSESISGDGLSQSFSADVAKFHDGIDDKLDDLRDAIHGIRMIAL